VAILNVECGPAARGGEASRLAACARITRTRAAPIAALLFAAAGMLAFGDGLWIYAKGHLAQYLLQRAWRLTLDGQSEVKPWPWADTWPIARLRIPEHRADYIVLAGASGRTLAFGPGHLDGTASPGSNGNCVLSAHRDTQFRVLHELQTGELIEVADRRGKVHRYRVRETLVVDRHDTSVLHDGSQGQLTLITCYPFDAVLPGGPLRYVVVAELV
jgi:sortase A